METRTKNLFLLPVLVACMCFIRAESASGQSGNYNGFNWEQSGNAATITGYTGTGSVVTIPGTIPDGSIDLPVTAIGANAFSFSQLTSVTVPGGVTNIGAGAFALCGNLTNVVLGSSVNNIGSEAFYECRNLTGINFPNSVTNIGAEAFQYAGLTNVTIGSDVTNIGDAAFSGCEELPAFTVDPENSFYSSQGGVLFDKNKTTLIQYPCGASAGSYTIPDTVTNIGDYAFSGCTNLTSVTIPDSVISINTNAFFFCLGLTSVTIPNSVTKFEYGAFLQCIGLTNVTIGTVSLTSGRTRFIFATICDRFIS